MKITDIISELSPGIVVVLKVAGLSTIIVLIISAILAIALSSAIAPLRVAVEAYVRIFRSIPILAMMMLLFFGLGALSPLLNLSAFWAAVAAICIVEIAYTSAIFRGAIESVDSKQWEAAKSIGLGRYQTYRRVILPQAVIPAIPPAFNMAIWVLKATALSSLITLNEVTLRANAIIVQHAQPLLVYTIVLLCYVIITVPLGYIGRWFENNIDNDVIRRVPEDEPAKETKSELNA